MKNHHDPILLQLLNRDHLPLFLSQHYPNGKMVEVGTYYGKFAEHVLDHWNGTLTCIDPWTDQPDSDYRDGCANGGRAGGRNPMAPIYKSAKETLQRFGPRVQIARMFSVDGRKLYEDGSLDSVYIDGNHAYDFARDDLVGWWAKVQTGGIIGIHDCYVRKDAVQNCGVWYAVLKFSDHIHTQPFLTNCSSAWWIKQ